MADWSHSLTHFFAFAILVKFLDVIILSRPGLHRLLLQYFPHYYEVLTLSRARKGWGWGNAFSFPIPRTKPNLQQLSKYSFSDSKGDPYLHTTINGAMERISREGCQLKKGLEALIKPLQVHIAYPNALRPHVLSKCSKTTKFLMF